MNSKLVAKPVLQSSLYTGELWYSGDTLKRIKAFLENRQQCVVVDGEKSNFVAVLSGAPQGSVIGPMLFLADINDLPQNIRSRVHLFADDTIL